MIRFYAHLLPYGLRPLGLFVWLLFFLFLPFFAWGAGSEQTINPLPQANSSFQSTLQTFLKREDAQRYELLFTSMVLSGGTHTTAGSLTAAPDALVAFPGGHYTTEVGSITYANNETTWVIAQKDLTGNLSNFARVAGTHYLIDSTSSSKPALPADSVWLMEVTTSGGAITAVVDLRTRVPHAGTYLLAELPAAGQRGRLAFVRDVGSGTLYLDNGTTWLQTISSNPLTTAGDMLVGGAGGAPTRLPKGTANQVLGMDSSATGQEYKTLTAGAGITVDHTPNIVTIASTVASPPGVLLMFMGTTAPAGWLLCDATAYDADTYPDLFDVYIPNAAAWGRGTAVGSFTVNTGTDTLTLAAHGLAIGSRVHVANTGGALPDGMATATKYFVINTTTDTLQLSATSGGGTIDITTSGSGTQLLYDKFQVPDLRARLPVGAGPSAHDFTISAVDTGTEELTIESNTALYTGDTVFYDTTVGAIGGLSDATNYYIIRVSAAVVKLASSEANANNGTAINLTGSGSGTQVLRQTLTTRTVGIIGGTEQSASVGAHAHSVTDPQHAHNENIFSTNGGTGYQYGGSAANSNPVSFGLSTDASSTGVSVNNSAGSIAPGNNMSPFLSMTFIIKT